jgi:porphobilinogen deaminase
MATPSSPTLPTNSGVSTTNTNTNPITKINIGTRRSQLAIAQVDSIIQQLKSLHLASPEIEYVPHVVSTMADENQVKSFSAFDSKSIWTEELEALLAKGELNVVVHCLKGSSSKKFHPISLFRWSEEKPATDVPTYPLIQSIVQ